MSDDRYRDREPYLDGRGTRTEGARRMHQYGEDPRGGDWMSDRDPIPYAMPYRQPYPMNDIDMRNADPYAAPMQPRGPQGSNGDGRGERGAPSVDHGYGTHDPRSGDRGMIDRASDEVASWFGDDKAAARRDEDHRGKGPRGYVRSDARILEDVNDRLSEDRWVDASDIDVRVTDAEVTLSGMVQSRGQKRRAEDCAEGISGVKHVQNNLRVAPQERPAF
ncbi:BON domain-containing protein [Falsirhodobacter algicola]|uniref:BON domain-containing protein n=1 Tax=Falsirhodobacter algicola TaxID=2692330 RepID=A0A8J8MUS1_9RHOB|nr:BON domain-containing protein [Falsirhodobacter algicola]QUS36668.1 BON domain-containing protein [Falsirhodobacter algicola]